MGTLFKGTDWLKLEIAIETIGDMIGYYSQELHKAIEKRADSKIISAIELELNNLGKERQMCYNVNSNQEIISKVLSEYVPKMREFNRSS
ncbi:MAG: hypothetical protein ACK5RG_07110 [Cyclobacteriaceae bacterium]|jgi:hypothetical protein